MRQAAAVVALSLITRFVLDRKAEKRIRETLQKAAEAAQAANDGATQPPSRPEGKGRSGVLSGSA